MRTNNENTLRAQNRIKFFFHFIKYLPKIGFRFSNLLFKRKKLTCKTFRPNNSYCIEGTLNQLIWKIENAVFITLSNSSKIFFDSGELLFHVRNTQSQFQLYAYGVWRTQKLQTQIKVVTIEKNNLTNVNIKSKHISVDSNRVINHPNISLHHVDNQFISFQNSLKPKSLENRKISFPNAQFLSPYSAALYKTNSIEEVRKLKQQIDKNQDVA